MNRLNLNSDFVIVFTTPTRLQRWFGEYKGGSVDFIVKDEYKEPGGLDWELLDDARVFDRFAQLAGLAKYMKDRGNEVKFIVSFCEFSINFKDINEAVWFRMNL